MSQRKSSARKSSQRGSQRGSGSGHIPASFVPSPGPIYQVPPSLGYERHTITLSRAPAYSMGGRISEQQRSGSGGPGPAGYSIAANYTRTGSAAIPRVSMSGRHKSLTYSSTPGPGAYAPEKFGDPMARRSPRWSMSDRTSLHKSSDTPGPAAYNLTSTIGRTSAERRSAPSYTISGRTKMNDFTHDYANSPGPGAYGSPNTALFNRTPPSFSMRSRRDSSRTSDSNPGPAAYYPDVNSNKKKPPSFSMGIRHSPWKAQVFVDKGDEFYLGESG